MVFPAIGPAPGGHGTGASAMTPAKHKWVFRARFRRHAFGWRSAPAIKRVKEAVAEIKKVARKDAALAAEGAVILLEKISPALEQVDSSSGAIGSAVNNAIAALVPILERAPVDDTTREKWLDRLWEAYQEDGIPYIETLGDCWGQICASPAMASRWADELIGTTRSAWNPDPELRGYFKGTTNCLSALLAAERYEELLALLHQAPYSMWHYRKYGVKALVAMGRKKEAIRYAEKDKGLNDSPVAIAQACEEILLSCGLADEAYERYGIQANEAGTYLAWFRAVAKKYPHKTAADVLEDLVASTPGAEGKWFAAAKSAGLYDEAIALAMQTPCSPQTLSRAARDFLEKNPEFAMQAGLTAMHWLVAGYGYDVARGDVINAFVYTLDAARATNCQDIACRSIRQILSSSDSADTLVTKTLRQELERFEMSEPA